MSSDSNHHSNNQRQLHNHYEFHNGHGLMPNREHETGNRVNNEQLESRELHQDAALIRGNMQYVNGELKKIPRPLNAFMIFSNEKRKELKKEFPGEPNNMISSRLGAAWKDLSDESRKRYHDMAHREDLEHRRKYPNYQYCPGHARKLKKARREQRLRQQGLWRSAKQAVGRQPQGMGPCPPHGYPKRPDIVNNKARPTMVTKPEPMRPIIKKEADNHGYPSASSGPVRHGGPNQIVHGMMRGSTSGPTMPGPHGEGRYPPASSYMPAPGGSSDCMMSCCKGCNPENIYCCPDSHWSTDALAAQHGFPPASFPPPMFYFAPGYDQQMAAHDAMLSQQCLVPGDCSGCFPSAPGFMDACYTPTYPAGDGNMCFLPNDMSMTTPPPNPATPLNPVASFDSQGRSRSSRYDNYHGPVSTPSNEGESEFTDISNNMVPSISRDSQDTSQRSCGSKGSYSISPSTLQEISPPVALNLSKDRLTETLV